MSHKITTEAFIYGAGYYGRALASELDKQSVRYEFIDAYAVRDSISGKYIYRPDEIDVQDKNSIVVYLTVFISPTEDGIDLSLVGHLEELGFAKVVNPYQIMKLFPQALENFSSDGFLWRQPSAPDYFDPVALDLIMGYLSDDRSRELLDNIAQFRQHCAVDRYIKPDFGPEYAPKGIDITCGLSQLHVADCGAFNGDTVKQFFSAFGERIRSYYAFEPESANYQQLLEVAKQAKQQHPHANIMCLPVGTSDANQVLRFVSGGGSGSHISDKGDCEIYMMRLDDILLNSSVNLIKIDVEGADLAVLKSAEQLVSQQKPNIAVSCYHKPGHIWQIPEYLKRVNGNYKMFLRQHGHYGLELTLYCIDESRL